MQHQRDTHLVADGSHAVNVQFCLAAFHGVDGAHRHGQRVATGALHKLECLVRVCHSGLHFFWHGAGLQHSAQLRLHRDASDVGDLDDLGSLGHVLFVEQLGAIEHERGKAFAQAAHVLLKAGAMVQVQHHRHIHLSSSDLDHACSHRQASVADGSLANLQDDRRTLLLGRLDDGLHHFQIVSVEGAHGKAGLPGVLQYFFATHKWHVYSSSKPILQRDDDVYRL